MFGSATTTASSSNQVVTINDSFLSSILGALTGYFDSLGFKITSGLAEFKKVVAETITVGASTKPAGITLYDDVTKAPYCLTISNGAPKATAGECGTITGGSPSVGGIASTTESVATSTSANGDTTPPVITLIGNNPVEIAVGTSYVDPGATATDNLITGIMPDMVLNNVNTGLVGQYQVVWTAHDAAMNTASVTRTVIVYDPNAATSTSPTATSTPTAGNLEETGPSSPIATTTDSTATSDSPIIIEMSETTVASTTATTTTP
jgi:hypothetical protein